MDEGHKIKLDSHPITKIAGWILLFFCFLILLTVAIHTSLAGNALGMDFHTFWQAARAVVIFDVNPYSDQVAEWSQLGVFGEIRPDGDQMGFAYPPYALFPILPLAHLPYAWAQAIWMALLILFLVSAAGLIVTARFKIVAALLILTPYPMAFGILLGNYAVLTGAILIATLGMISKISQEEKWIQALLGILLAWSTIKPQAIWMLIIVVLWVSCRKRFYTLLTWFGGSLFSLFLLSFVIVPNWPATWAERVQKYSNYNPSTYPRIGIILQQFLPIQTGQFLLVLILLVVISCTAWVIFRGGINPDYWYREIGWAALGTYLLLPSIISYSQIIFMIPVFMWAFKDTSRRSNVRISFFVFFSFFTWLVTFWIGRISISPVVEDLNLLLYLIWLIGLSINQRTGPQ